MHVEVGARSFGAPLVSGTRTDFRVYPVGPLLGAAAGAFAYQLVRGQRALAQQTQRIDSERDGARTVRLPA